jgi:hypothetical protein
VGVPTNIYEMMESLGEQTDFLEEDIGYAIL